MTLADASPLSSEPIQQTSPSEAGPLGRPKKAVSTRVSAGQAPWTFVIPALLIFALFYLLPTILGAWYAFTEWNGFAAPDWVGLENFRTIAEEPRATSALQHTLVLAVVYVVGVNAVGLLLALGLNSSVKSAGVLRALFFFPAIVSPLAVAYIWQYILTLDGALNQILRGIGLDSMAQPWLGQGGTALMSIAVVMVWQTAGWMMLIYLAGLQGIQQELYEAASVDGAGSWRRFMDITRPLLLPSFTVSLVLSTILALTVFDQVIGLTGGGPIGATDTISTHIYKSAFQDGRFGYSSAVAVLLTIGVMLVAATQMWLIRRQAKWKMQ